MAESIGLTLSIREAEALQELIDGELADNLSSRGESCFLCGADLVERDHERDCRIPHLIPIAERLRGLYGGC